MIDFDETDLTPRELQSFARWFEKEHGHWITIAINDSSWSTDGPCKAQIGIRGYFGETEYVHAYGETFREALVTAYLMMWNKIGNESEATIHAAALKLIELTFKEGKGVHVSKLRMHFKAKLIDANMMNIMLRAEEIADSGPFLIVGDAGNGAPVSAATSDEELEIPF